MKYMYGIAIALMLCATMGFARGSSYQIRVKSTKDFNRVLDKHALVVALFYKNDRDTRKNKELNRKIELLEDTVKRIAERDRYKDARIAFVRINIIGDDLESLAQSYDVETMPTFMIFKHGGVVRGGITTGFIDARELRLFIDQHIGRTINAFVQAEAERRRRKHRRTYTYVGFGAYPGYYGYPYYGGVGFGFGF